jgi:protoporphyrinogen oxidase
MDQPILIPQTNTEAPVKRKAIIIGAGPAGLTAAYELLKRSDIIPVILEKSGDIGGISKTINYKGNRMDIGGHRFFSKSDRVMNWWLNILPAQDTGNDQFTISYQNRSRQVAPGESVTSRDSDKVMLVRERLSRIYFLRKFFTYPIQLSIDTLRKLGVGTTISILVSYLQAQASPRKPETSLEDFMINRFGKTLYNLFFKDYTEKVWGVPCHEIPAEWGAQRIKGVSIRKAIQHAVQSAVKKKKSKDISQKDTETSLIEQFLYPKLGPGQLWEEVAHQVQEMGGTILMHHDVISVNAQDGKIISIEAFNKNDLQTVELKGDYFFSTMPVKELIASLEADVPQNVKEVAAGLQYRDFITVGILLKNLSEQDKRSGKWKPLQLKDTWIYIQEKDVKVGRLQLFNNWSPYLVKDPNTAWVGMEFFCNETDDFWKMPDEKIAALAIRELQKIGLANASDVLDSTVLRVEKTYPAYFGAYERFDEVKQYVNTFPNLFLVGRNGMHKYNNADHSMLTAMVSVDNIIAGETGKDNIWSINTEQEYHEEKTEKTGQTA